MLERKIKPVALSIGSFVVASLAGQVAVASDDIFSNAVALDDSDVLQTSQKGEGECGDDMDKDDDDDDDMDDDDMDDDDMDDDDMDDDDMDDDDMDDEGDEGSCGEGKCGGEEGEEE